MWCHNFACRKTVFTASVFDCHWVHRENNFKSTIKFGDDSMHLETGVYVFMDFGVGKKKVLMENFGVPWAVSGGWSAHWISTMLKIFGTIASVLPSAYWKTVKWYFFPKLLLSPSYWCHRHHKSQTVTEKYTVLSIQINIKRKHKELSPGNIW